MRLSTRPTSARAPVRWHPLVSAGDAPLGQAHRAVDEPVGHGDVRDEHDGPVGGDGAVGFDGGGRLIVKDEMSVKLPEFNRPTTSFFVDKHGNASRRDPNQPSLPHLDDRRALKEGTTE